MKITIIFPLTFLLLIQGQVSAHHSTARYDMETRVSIEGTVTRFSWSNPHVYIYVSQQTEYEKSVEWEIEQFPPAILKRMGWNRNTISQGDKIIVEGYPTRSERKPGIYPLLLKKSGVVLFEAADNAKLADASVVPETGATSIEGVWETLASRELIVSIYSVETELTDAGQAALEEYDENTMLPGSRCIPYSSPLLMIDPDFKKITIEDNQIQITGGYAGAVRTIYLNRDSHEGAERSLQGHSTGYWDAGTLVIDTSHFSYHRTANSYRGVPSGEQKHLLEYLTLADDGRSINYRFEVTDPEYLAEPLTGEVEWVYRPDVEYTYEKCKLENARRYLE